MNNDCYLLTDSVYPQVSLNADTVISQSSIDSLSPKVLSKDDMVSIQNSWRNGNFNVLKSGWSYPPHQDKHWYEGYWFNIDNKYIGIRYKNLLGWIKIGVTNNNSAIKIYEFALSK